MKDLEAKVRELADVVRRISNQEIMLAEKMAKRAALVEDPRRARDLPALDHRISNAEIMLSEKRARRDAIQAELDAEIARTEVRLGFIDFDARREPLTQRWCIRCQRDLAPGDKARRIRLVHVDGAPHAMAAEDITRFESGRLALPSGSDDRGWVLIGPECIRRQGIEWTVPE